MSCGTQPDVKNMCYCSNIYYQGSMSSDSQVCKLS